MTLKRINKKKSTLRRIAETLLVEAEKDENIPGEDSLDDQVDKYLVSYESESRKSKSEGLDFRMMTRRFLIEAGEEDEKDEKKDEEGKEDEKGEEIDAQKSSLEDLDMGSFVSDVMRLVDNYDSLLEAKNTILRRASNYLLKNYEKDAADAFKAELLDSYGIEIGKSKSEIEDEKYQPPKAGASGPVGGGT